MTNEQQRLIMNRKVKVICTKIINCKKERLFKNLKSDMGKYIKFENIF